MQAGVVEKQFRALDGDNTLTMQVISNLLSTLSDRAWSSLIHPT